MKIKEFIARITNLLEETLLTTAWRKEHNKYYKDKSVIVFDFMDADCGLIGVTIDFNEEAKREKIKSLLRERDINIYSRCGVGGLFPAIEFTIKEDVDINIYKTLFDELSKVL